MTSELSELFDFSDDPEARVAMLPEVLGGRLVMKSGLAAESVPKPYVFADEEPKRGGFGYVYKIRSVTTDERCADEFALKVFPVFLDLAPSEAENWQHETNILVSLRNNCRGVTKIRDSGLIPTYTDGTGCVPAIIMDWEHGRTIEEDLREIRSAKTLTGSQVAHQIHRMHRIATSLCEVVAELHRRARHSNKSSLAHCDLKPSNIILRIDPTDPTAMPVVRLIDFGIATLGDGRIGGVTPRYAAPEQLAGGAATERVDQYQVGAVIGELVAALEPHFPCGQLARLIYWLMHPDACARWLAMRTASRRMTMRKAADRWRTIRQAVSSLSRPWMSLFVANRALIVNALLLIALFIASMNIFDRPKSVHLGDQSSSSIPPADGWTARDIFEELFKADLNEKSIRPKTANATRRALQDRIRELTRLPPNHPARSEVQRYLRADPEEGTETLSWNVNWKISYEAREGGDAKHTLNDKGLRLRIVVFSGNDQIGEFVDAESNKSIGSPNGRDGSMRIVWPHGQPISVRVQYFGSEYWGLDHDWISLSLKKPLAKSRSTKYLVEMNLLSLWGLVGSKKYDIDGLVLEGMSTDGDRSGTLTISFSDGGPILNP